LKKIKAVKKLTCTHKFYEAGVAVLMGDMINGTICDK